MVISQGNRQKLDLKEYHLTRIRALDKMENFTDSQNVYIKFILNDNTVTGMDGCNSFSGKLIINKDSISFLNFATSRMFCQDVKVDKIFYQLISKVNRYKFSGNSLKLYNGKKLLFEYSQK
jgi:heat shock protein HslJ